MSKFKSHKSPEEIAKKHRLNVSLINHQLQMGIPIEHEHTQNKELATYIALQHLDEIPDYYTRLKKMEADSKKNHKKFTDVKENLDKWFSKDDPEGNWRRFNTKGEAIGPCAREPGEPKPKCLSNEKSQSMSKSQIAAAVKRKRIEDPVADRSGKGGKPIMSSNKNFKFQNVVEEKCGKGMYWCNTNKECKPLPTGFNVPGQKIKPTEVGIGKPVEGACNHTKKGKTCPIHGNEDCSMKESKDHEYSMARSELSTIMNAAKRLQTKIGKGEGNVEAWVQSKITKAADYLDSAADYVDSGEMDEAANPAQQAAIAINMKKKGIKPKSEVDEACWVGYKQVGLKKKGKKMVPNCVPEELSFNVGKPSRGVGALTPDAAKQLGTKATELQKKRAAEVNLPTVKKEEYTGIVSKILEQLDGEEKLNYLEEKNKPTNPSLWSKAKSLAKQKFDVYPSAYANGWASKWYKSKGGGWKSVSEETIEESTYMPSRNGQVISVLVSWRGLSYMIKMFFPQPRIPNRREVSDQIEKVYPGGKVLMFKVSTIQPGEPIVQVTEETIEEVAAWQKKEGKNPEGGLNEKGRKSYEAENPGSNLQAPQPQGGPRKRSFCPRMGGMPGPMKDEKGRPTRKALALRKWNC